jgi:hypothetical protein
MTYRGAGKQPPTPTSTLTVRDDEQENRRYWFARHCYKHRREIAPSGRTWEEAFHRLEGFSLRDYMQFSKKNKLGEKYGIPNKSR